MSSNATVPTEIYRAVKWPLRLTHWGMLAERVVRCFWPLWSVIFVALALLMLGVQDMVRVEWVWGAAGVLVLAMLWTLGHGVRRFHWPTRDGALARLDQTLKGNPIQAALDNQAIGAEDAASLAVWRAHQARMRAKLAEARAVEPDLRVSRADPFALRYVALLAFSTALVFGSFLRVQSVTAMAPGDGGLTSGPTWEGWMEPPAYTRLPSIYLNDITAQSMNVPQGARITLRMYGEVGALSVTESVSGAPLAPEDGATATAQDFDVVQSGRIAIDGPGGRAWEVAMTPDGAPSVAREGEVEVSYDGNAQIPYAAQDDYGIVAGTARFTLALDEVDRRYGLTIDPEARPTIEVPLPMPIAGDRAEFTETLIENFSEHPWANLPVRLELTVEDDAGQTGLSEPEVLPLPGRRFFDPMAAAVIEQRRALLWNRDNARAAAQVLRAVSHRPDDMFRSAVHYLRLRTIIRRTELFAAHDMTVQQQQELADAMWDLALLLEEGDLDDALERLQRAQDRLSEAMKNGASDQEIAELMQELRQATDEYLRQLSRQAQQQRDQNGDMAQQQQQQGDMMEMSQSDLQQMMDRIQELMEQGRMAEAQEALDQLRQMMENMQVTQGPGQQGQSPGQQAMEGLAETLREQQGLSDQAFRDLQEQFNPGANQGQNQGNEGRDGGQGRGQQHSQQGQGGQGQGQQQGQGSGDQQQGQGQGGQSMEDSLADRQQALRDELNRQRGNLPGAGTEAGERAAEALGRAEGAMDGAENALRDGDLAEAIDRQSEAMEALREGMRNLGEALAEQQQQNQGQQGMADGSDPGTQRDPLGRDAGSNGQLGTEEGMLQGEDVYRRARELLDEIRRRSGEGERPDEEIEYLERLLERF
ncbi:TIGR02302 family protein [Aestuariicoccus sp. MJ-SS9]|uniref:TIGR02302 family protein n=1 Tax=Aestuariicoccus sp. MJ-SS9 TaxID=3079855 RepID=UPI0029141481|nr:TIGR02302 family protein [Aestuariicoccus sp. MJ-SS9]MDU8910734.1 TIGR02302 family protein [Aestuariicoccus sp. MJ-SS9]